MKRRASFGFVGAFVLAAALLPAFAQNTSTVIGTLNLTVGGISATVTPAEPVIPVNVASGVQIVVTLGGQTLSANAVAQYLGGNFQVQGTYSGAGLAETVNVPQSAPATNSLVLDLPAVNEAGNYTLSNLRFIVNGNDVLDISPNKVTVDVIDQVIVTSVQTQALTLAQIQAMGVVLDSGDYTGFQFTVGLQVSSQIVNISLPVVFDPQGVPVPQPLSPPTVTTTGLATAQVPVTVVPVLLTVPLPAPGQPGSPPLPNGIQIPCVLVIPGNVGYLKQFFSAQLYAANDTPAEANLVVDNISGTINLPAGPSGVVGGSDEPLGLPNLTSGAEAATMPILLNGTSSLAAGQTGQAQWTIVANTEGFYDINFGINATLEGLPTGPVNVSGTAMGGLLVRNPYFNMTFTVPGVVRSGELFNVYTTVTNTSQAVANNLTVAIDEASLSGMTLVSTAPPPIPTLSPGDSVTLQYQFRSSTTGEIVANYLNFNTENGSTGTLSFTLGVYANGTPMSPDTIQLPSSVDNLPNDVVMAAMRVLGQAWSVATAPPGTLPATVIPTTVAVVTKKAQALAEAGLRQTLGEPQANVLRDLGPDFWSGSPVDPGFNQVLQTTPAGQNFDTVLGADLAQWMLQGGGPLPYELQLSQVLVSGPSFLAFAVGSGTSSAPVTVSLTDSSGDQLSTATPGGSIPGGLILSLSNTASTPLLGLVTAPALPPYTLLLTPTGSGSVDLSIAIPSGNGTVIRGQITGATVTQGQAMKVVADFTNPNNLVLLVDTTGNGTFATSIPLTTQVISPPGPTLTSATVLGPDTVSQAGPFGLNMALLFDRPVDATTSAITTNYTIPNNSVLAASRELSGRLVFGDFSQPEGPYVPTTVAVNGVADLSGTVGPPATVNLQSLLVDPGAVVSGQVLQANGTPSSTATVTYVNNPTMPSCMSPAQSAGIAATQVNSAGYYQFRYVWQNQCGIPFQMATTDPTTKAAQTVSTYVRGAGEQIVLNLAMLSVGSVTGQVTDVLGNAVSDAEVAATSGSNPQVGGQTFTDGNGNYTINNITVGPVNVTAVSGSTLGSNVGNILLAGAPATVNVVLNGGNVKVSGTVTLLQNGVSSPLAGIQVVYYSGSVAAGVTTTAVDGSYSMTNLPTGPYTVAVNAPPTESLAGAVQTGVAAAGAQLTIPLEVVVPTTGTVNGTVSLPNGTPYSGAIVYENGQTAGVLSAANGTYSLPGVPIASGLQIFVAQTSDGLRTGQTSVAVNSATPVNNVNITLSGLGTARFLVLGLTGQPIVGQSVYLTGSSGCYGTAQTTDANGIATFTGLPVGSITAVAFVTAGYNDLASATVSITQDGATASGTMQFHGVGTVAGSVSDPTGKPVTGALVQLTANHVNFTGCSMASGQVQSVETNASGIFAFSDVNVGPVSVTAMQAFYPAPAGAQGLLTGNGTTVTLPLQFVNTIAGTLSGTVFLPDGVTAAPNVQVTASGPYPNTSNVSVTSNAAGFYQFAAILPQGTYTLTAADALSGGVTQMTVYLLAGQSATQNLRLLGTGTINVTVVDGAGNPVTTTFLTLTESGYPNASFSGSVSAANQGVVSFANVFEGAFSVQATDPLGRGGRASGTLPQGVTSLNIQVQLTTTGTVQGNFYQPDGATPVPNALVTLSVNGQIAGEATSQSTGNIGAYVFNYVPAGAFTLTAQDPLTGRTGTSTGSITTQGQTVTLNIVEQGLATVTGLVTENGAPQAGATVVVVSGQYTATTTADSTGTYTITGVPVGTINVTASLGNGFLSGTASASVGGDGNTLNLPVTLASSGSVTGQVVQANGSLAPPSLVTIAIAGSSTQVTSSDAQGNFSFTQVPAGSGTITAHELGGVDQGAAPVIVPAGGSTNVVVTFNGLGSIAGVALDSSGNPIAAATIVVTSGTANYYSYTTVSAADGTFSLSVIPAGAFTATLSATIDGFAVYGMTTGTVTPYQTTNITIQAQPSGAVSGQILHADGVTPDAGALVSLTAIGQSGPSTVVADSQGNYNFYDVPLGAFSLSVTDPVTSDRGAATGQVTTNGQSVTVNVRLNGVGSVTVQVNYAAGGVVPNAILTLTGQGTFGGSYSGTTLANGSYTFPSVLAGTFSVNATDPATGFGGIAYGTVAPSGGAVVTVTLQPVLTVQGYVYNINAAPVAQSMVVLNGFNVNGPFSLTTASASNGSFEFTNLQEGTYTVSSYDTNANLRARSSSFSLSTVGPTTVSLTWQAIGTVTGYVYDPNGSPAIGAPIIMQSSNPSLAEYLQTAADSSGAYTINGVPIGNFTISVSYPSANLIGNAPGTITQDGQQVTVDVYLVTNAVSLPVSLFDGNDYLYNPQPNGSIGSGDDEIFSYFLPQNETGGFNLNILSGGSPIPFTGNSEGSQELSGRQTDITQDSLAGLTVTRKIYIPPSGYFVRYLEELNNPGSTAITVGVQVVSNEAAQYWPDSIVASSSGNATLNVTNPQNPDRWVVIDGTEGASNTGEPPVVAYALDGPGAAMPVDTATFSTPLYDSAEVLYQWSSVTVPPGGSVAFLHFGVQQSNRGSAQASAARLVTLPPEALMGISAQDLAVIRNFAVPAGGVSAVAPLPALNGTVTGYLYSGDGATPIPGQVVTLQSNNAYFNRQMTAYTGPTGLFTFSSSLNSGSESAMVLPVDSFTLAVLNPLSAAASASVTANFPSGEDSVAQNIVLAGTGTITGTVTYFSGSPVSSGYVSASEPGSPYYSPSSNISASGTYTLVGIPAGSDVVTASVPTGGSGSYSASSPVTVIAGQSVTADVVLQATSSVTGNVSTAGGGPLSSIEVYLSNASQSAYAYTDVNGNYTISNIQVGTYTATAYPPYGIANYSPSAISAQVSVVAGQATVQNFTFPALPASGTIQVTVTNAGGTPVSGAGVQLYGIQYLSSNASGQATFTGVPTGAFTINVSYTYPDGIPVTTQVTGTITSGGSVVSLAIVLPADPGLATIAGQITEAGGGAASGLIVSAYLTNQYGDEYYYTTVTTNASGNYSLTGLTAGATPTIRVSLSNYQVLTTISNVAAGAAGTTTTLNISLPAQATVQVTVLNADSSPAANLAVYIQDNNQPYFGYAATTNASGVATIANVPQGAFTVQTNNPYNGSVLGSATGNVAVANNGGTVAVTINLVFIANLQGTVYAADGQTPLPNVLVEAIDPVTTMQVGSTYTATNGAYQLYDVAPSTNSFQVVAVDPQNSNITTTVNGTFSSPGQTETINVTLPMSILTGTVTYSDGTPVSYPTVFVLQTDSMGNVNTYNASSTDGSGDYAVFGVPVGAFAVYAQDSTTGLSGSASSSIVQLATAVQLPVPLQPSGTVSGNVQIWTGGAVPYAEVIVSSAAINFDRDTYADQNGNYSIPYIALGEVVVSAVSPAEYPNLPATGGAVVGAMTTSGQTLTLNVPITQTSTVSGTVFASDGVTPVPDAFMAIESLLDGGLAEYRTYEKQGGEGYINIQSDSTGNFTFGAAPIGNVEVTAVSSDGSTAGWISGTLGAGSTLTLDPIMGNATSFPSGSYVLTDPNNFVYDIACDGSLSQGGQNQMGLVPSYSGAASMLVDANSAGFCQTHDVGALDQNGQQVTIGPKPGGSPNALLEVTRRAYVPPSGGYIRYLDSLTNPLSVPITTTVEIDTNFSASDTPDTLLVDPTTNGSTFALLEDSTSTAPLLGFVFAGTNSSVPPITSFSIGTMPVSYVWTVTVPPNQTVTLMHFLIQSNSQDISAATAQGQALVNLTDPNELNGMSAQQQAQVVNFNVQ